MSEKHDVLTPPAIGRMKLANNTMFEEKFNEIMTSMRNASFIYLPMILAGGAKPAFADEIGEIAGMPDYSVIFRETGFDFFQQLVNVNKFLIEFIDTSLESIIG